MLVMSHRKLSLLGALYSYFTDVWNAAARSSLCCLHQIWKHRHPLIIASLFELLVVNAIFWYSFWFCLVVWNLFYCFPELYHPLSPWCVANATIPTIQSMTSSWFSHFASPPVVPSATSIFASFDCAAFNCAVFNHAASKSTLPWSERSVNKRAANDHATTINRPPPSIAPPAILKCNNANECRQLLYLQ